MKVLFIVPYPTEGPSNRFRVEQYLPFLKEKGISYSLRPFCNSYIYKVLFKKGYYLRKVVFVLYFLLRRVGDVFKAASYDVIFIHREAYPFKGCILERLFRLFGKKIIFDFDDAIFIKKPLKTRKIVTMSDCVIAGNEFLKKYASLYNEKIVLLPTCINSQIYRPRIKDASADKVIIGWIGTSFTAIYLEMLREVFIELAARHKNIEFRIIGGHIKADGLPLVCKEWSLESEINELQEFDVGIMPLFDNDMARGKCGFKMIQYMAVGIPSVASRVGVSAEIIEEGKEGFLALTAEEWINKLSLLIEDRALRERIGKSARSKVERLYSVETNKQKFIDILEKVHNLR